MKGERTCDSHEHLLYDRQLLYRLVPFDTTQPELLYDLLLIMRDRNLEARLC